MPEISLLLPLCHIRCINVNALSSGRALSQEDYAKKAEGTMMAPMQKTEEQKNAAAAPPWPCW